MLNYSFVYSDPTRETVTISIDDFGLIEMFLTDVMSHITLYAGLKNVNRCRDYCNLYLDIEHEFELVKESRAERLKKEQETEVTE